MSKSSLKIFKWQFPLCSEIIWQIKLIKNYIWINFNWIIFCVIKQRKRLSVKRKKKIERIQKNYCWTFKHTQACNKSKCIKKLKTFFFQSSILFYFINKTIILNNFFFFCFCHKQPKSPHTLEIILNLTHNSFSYSLRQSKKTKSCENILMKRHKIFYDLCTYI